MITLASVLLPEPFGPISAWTWPSPMVRLTPFRISLPSMLTCRSSMTSALGLCCPFGVLVCSLIRCYFNPFDNKSCALWARHALFNSDLHQHGRPPSSGIARLSVIYTRLLICSALSGGPDSAHNDR